MQFYIGDNLLDLYPDRVISISLRRNDINNLSSRFVSFTNEIVVPLTANNLSILGLQSPKSDSNTVYSKLSCKLVINGYEVLSYGVATVVGVDDGIRIQVYESDIDSFQKIKGLSLVDVMRQTVYRYNDSGWEKSDIDNARNNTDGIISAYLDWGIGFNTDFFWPCYFYRTAILAIADYIDVANVEFGTNPLLSGDIQDLVFAYLPQPLRYQENINDLIFCTVENTGTQNLLATGDVTFLTNILTEGAIDIYDGPNGEIFVSEDVELNISINLQGTATRSAPSDTFDIVMVKDVAGVLTTLDTYSYVLAGAPTLGVNVTLSATVQLNQNDKVYARFVTTSGAPTMFFFDGSVTANGTTFVSRGNVHWEYLLPSDLTAESFLKDWILRFGIIFKPSDSGLRIKKLNDIMADRASAIDWTDKFVSSDKAEFSAEYARDNYFKYKNDDELDGLGRGTIQVDSALVENEKTIYTSIFSGCQTRTLGGVRAAYLPAFETGAASITDTANAVPLTLLTIRDKGTKEPNKVFNTTPRNDYSVAYFVDTTQTKDTNFQYFLDSNYAILEDSLQKNRVEERFYNLTEKDIFEYDPFKMIYDNGEYYLINKIDNFVPGRITKVELFRV